MQDQVVFLFDKLDFTKLQEHYKGFLIKEPKEYPVSCIATVREEEVVLTEVNLEDLSRKFYKYCRKRKFAVERRKSLKN